MTEKPWWMATEYWFEDKDGDLTEPNIEAIVAEAHRRGKLEAWNEARELCDEYRDAIDEEIAKLR